MISSKYLHNMVGFIPPFWVGYPSESRENLYISKTIPSKSHEITIFQGGFP